MKQNAVTRQTACRIAKQVVEVIASLVIAESGCLLYMNSSAPKLLSILFVCLGMYFTVDTLVKSERAKERLVVYVDMDGSLAKWHTATPEQLRTAEYFKEREEEANLVEAIRLLQRRNVTVRILTAVMSEEAKRGKREWLAKYSLDHIPVIFVPCGENKALYIEKIEKNADQHVHVLVDDFSDNLHAWEDAGNVAIKFRNQINGKRGTWEDKAAVYYFQSPQKIADSIINVALNAAMDAERKVG